MSFMGTFKAERNLRCLLRFAAEHRRHDNLWLSGVLT
jgi:hypothetical protein